MRLKIECIFFVNTWLINTNTFYSVYVFFIVNVKIKYGEALTCIVPDLLIDVPVRFRDSLELARTISNRDW